MRRTTSPTCLEPDSQDGVRLPGATRQSGSGRSTPRPPVALQIVRPASDRPDRSSSLDMPASPENPTQRPHESSRSARRFRRAAGSVLLAHALLVVLFTLLLAAVPAWRGRFDASTLRGAALGILLMQGGFILLPTLAVILLAKARPQLVTGDRARPSSLFLAVLIGIPAAVVLSGLNNLFLFLLSRAGLQMNDSLRSILVLDFDRRTPLELALTGIVAIVLPAIAEELMFRGLIQGSLRERNGEGTAIFLQAFAFMAFHTNPAFLLPPFLAGLLLGLIRSRTGSLLPAVAAHLSLNATLALLGAVLPRLTQRLREFTAQSPQSLLYASVMAACLAAVALVPLIILIAGNPPEFRYRRQRDRRRPVDIPFALATLLLIGTVLFRYFNP